MERTVGRLGVNGLSVVSKARNIEVESALRVHPALASVRDVSRKLHGVLLLEVSISMKFEDIFKVDGRGGKGYCRREGWGCLSNESALTMISMVPLNDTPKCELQHLRCIWRLNSPEHGGL